MTHSVTLYAFFGYCLLVFAGVLALRVLVLVMILEADLVNVFVRVAVVPVRVLVGDVLMLVAVMGVRVRMVIMRVLVVVWFLVIVLSVHLLSFHVGIREAAPVGR